MVNPNPARVTEPLWWFVEQCVAYVPGSQNGGTYVDKPGSHNTRNNLIAQGLTNDYSIRDPLNRQGPGDKGAAFDWTFPNAQAGDYTTIIMIMRRIDAAYWAGDPRTYGLFEVLGQADADAFAEGYVFYPSKHTRTPDASHLWHIHWGIIRAYLNDWRFFRGLFSIVRGLTYQQWLEEENGMTEEQWQTLQWVAARLYAFTSGAEDPLWGPPAFVDSPERIEANVDLNKIVAGVDALVARPAAGTLALSPEDRAAIVADIRAELGPVVLEQLQALRLVADMPV